MAGLAGRPMVDIFRGAPYKLPHPMPSYEETLLITTEVLVKHVELDRAIKPTDHIQNDLGLDSLGVMEVVADIEDRLQVSIPTDALDGLATVEDVARVLMKIKA